MHNQLGDKEHLHVLLLYFVWFPCCCCLHHLHCDFSMWTNVGTQRLKLKIIGSYEIFHVSLHLWRSLRNYLGERKPQQRSLFSADIHQINFRVELKPSLCAPLGLWGHGLFCDFTPFLLLPPPPQHVVSEALRENPKNKCKVLKLGEMGKFNATEKLHLFFRRSFGLGWSGRDIFVK